MKYASRPSAIRYSESAVTPKKRNILRQKMARRAEKKREQAGRDEPDPGQLHQRPAVGDQRVEQAASSSSGWSTYAPSRLPGAGRQNPNLTGTIPAASKYGSNLRASAGQW